MLFNIISTLTESIIMFTLWLIITAIFSKILRISLKGKIFKFFISLLIINSLFHITKITNPEQNYQVLILIITIFYYLLFFIIPKIKWWAKKVWKLRFPIVFFLFIICIIIVWKWEFLNSWATPLSNKLSIWNNQEILYNSFWWINPNIAFSNDYATYKYDTIKHDINLDNIVDITTIDKNEDGTIDDVIIQTYNLQKILLLIIFSIFSLLSILFTKKIKKIKEEKIDNTENGDKEWKKEENNIETEDKEKIDEETKEKDEKSKEINEEFKDEEKIEENKKESKIISLILILSLLLSSFGTTFWMTPHEIEAFQVKSKICASDPFNDSKCKWVAKTDRILLQHAQNPVFVRESDALVKRQQDCAIKKCSEKEITNLRTDYQNWQQKWLKTTPINYWKESPVTKDDWKTEDIENWTKDFLNDNVIKPSWDKPNNEIKDSYSIQENELIISDIATKIKDITEANWRALSGINAIIWKELQNNLKWVPSWQNPSIEDIEKIEKELNILLWNNSNNPIEILRELSNKLDDLNNKSPIKSNEVLKTIWNKWENISKIITSLNDLSNILDSYNNIKNLEQTFDWNFERIFIAKTWIKSVQNISSSNPVDIITNILSSWLSLAKLKKESKIVNKYSISKNIKQMALESYINDSSINDKAETKAQLFFEKHNNQNTTLYTKITNITLLNISSWFSATIWALKVWLWKIWSIFWG